MKALIQRVKSAAVDIHGERHGEIGPGMLVLLGVERTDTTADADKLLKKCSATGCFPMPTAR